ncbi:hypothetical protein HS048_34335 [Planomonospora sp. ID91781]|uniref:hypothetical protein n=1 Tax=Planomonospora sp. ID91781 TaxID=2738135 RepID=UPI0018C4056F|nr:hypothetical protein [Planomonospora sp. ID91781]MBG0825765.1 hypothetical protein [Planomonospora sp. ID91781]
MTKPSTSKGKHWRHLPSEERITDPAFRAHVAASRAACGLPPHVEDPATLAYLANLMTMKP